MAWSSFEKDKLIIEGFRDFFKKKEKFVGTYPASELTTIVNLISNLAKKLNIKVDTSAIVDEFEAVLKSENYNLQEQEDKIMIGGDVPLDLTKTPKLKAFMVAVAQANKRGLGILSKALERGAFKVSGYESAASTGQTPTEEPRQRASAFPIQITVDEFSKFINESDFETIKSMFNKLGVKKEKEEIRQRFKSLLPHFFKSFDKALVDSDVGDYFRLQTQVEETINIKDRLGAYSDPESNLFIFLFGALLKKYIKKRSKEVQSIVGELPSEVLTQLQNSVTGVTTKTLNSILSQEDRTAQPAANPQTADADADEEETETDKAQPAPEPVSEPQATEQPTEKTPAETAVELLNGIEGSEQPEITVELFNDFVRDLKSFIEEINRQKRKVSEITIKQISTKLGLKPYKFTEFIRENEKYRPIVVRLQWAQKDENVLNSFVNAFKQVAKSLPADTPTKSEPNASTTDTSAEPSPSIAAIPDSDFPLGGEPLYDPELDSDEESEPADSKNTKSDPIKELRSYIDEVKGKIEFYNEEDYRENVLPTSLSVVKDFKNKYLNLVTAQTNKQTEGADKDFGEKISFLVKALESKRSPDETKIEYIDFYIKNLEDIKSELTFEVALDIFKEVVEPIKQFLSSQIKPELAEPEAPAPVVEPEQAEERTFKRLGGDNQLRRLRKSYSTQFNSGRQGKMAQFTTKKNNIQVFSISDRDKYDQNDPQDVEMAYDTWNSTYDIMKKIPSNTLKDKVKAWLLGLEGWIKEAEKKSPTKLEESLMLRWKTIAGIK